MTDNSSRKDSSPELGTLTAAWNIGGPDYLPYRLLLVAKLLDRCTTRLLSESCGLTVAEWRVLAQLALNSPSTARQLAEQAWVDRAEVSRAVSSLIGKKLVSKRLNPKDRRSAKLSVTPAGKRLFDRIRPLRAEFHGALTHALTPDAMHTVDEALVTFAQRLLQRLESDAT